MKKKKFIILFTFAIIFTNGIYLKLHALSYPSEVDVVWISFNYDQNSHTYDALSIKKDGSSGILEKEWGGYYSKFAYIKNQTNRRIQVLFHHNQDTTQSYSVVIKADVATGTGLGNGSKMVNFPSNNGGNSDVTIFQLNGTLPNCVGEKHFLFTWDAVMPVQIHYGYTGHHHYFVLLTEPKAPMAIPWVDVLNYACDWADGKSSSSTALEALTKGLYYNSGLVYGSTHYKKDNENNQTKWIFHLTDFLDDWNYADCQDCSMFLSILSSSIGASLTKTRSIYPKNADYFNAKKVLKIGEASWKIPEYWAFHQVACNDDGTVIYDPTLKLKEASPYLPIEVNINNPYKLDFLIQYYDWVLYSPFQLGVDYDPRPYGHYPTVIE